MYLNKFLISKEKSYLFLKQLILNYQKPVITIKLNIPGPKKNKKLYSLFLKKTFKYFQKIFKNDIFDFKYKFFLSGNTYFVIFKQLNPLLIKQKLLQSEKKFYFPRIIDFDVYDLDFKPISRNKILKCFMCKSNYQFCRLSNNHKEDLIKFIDQKLKLFAFD